MPVLFFSSNVLNTLIKDIRKLLEDWAEDIHDCERIWIRASVSNRRIFLDYEGAVIEKGTYIAPHDRSFTDCYAKVTIAYVHSRSRHVGL